MSKNQIKPLSRKSDIVFQESENEILIYDLTINKAFCLNETSALIWQACDGSKTVSEISNQISRQLNSPINEDFVWLALEQLKKENLLENKKAISAPFEGLSRRDVIRRVGLATVVALPIVSSLIAPLAVHAVSCILVNNTTCRCPCTTPDNSTCGQGTTLSVPNAQCNPNCTCTRTGNSCADPAGPSANTAIGSCSA